MRRLTLVALIVLVAVPVASAGEQAFRFGEFGALKLDVPESWQFSQESVGPVDNAVGLTVVFRSDAPNAWEVLISGFWNLGQTPSGDPDDIKEAVQKIASKTLGQVKETSIRVVPIAEDPSLGYMFSVTDADPKPGEYRRLTQGIAQIGDVLTSFSVLTNEGDETIRQSLVRMLRGASHVKN